MFVILSENLWNYFSKFGVVKSCDVIFVSYHGILKGVVYPFVCVCVCVRTYVRMYVRVCVLL